MPAKGRIPSYRLHRATGQAVVTIAGKDHYLGKHGTEASRKAYDGLISRWTAGGRRAVEQEQGATVTEVALAFWKWAEGYYRKNGRPTSQVGLVARALAPLRKLYGTTPAADFGPAKLKVYRQSWVDRGVSRTGVNRHTAIIKQCFRWAAEHEMVPGEVTHALRAVKELAYGRSEAPERPRVLPVPEADLEAVLGHLGPRDAALVRLQLASGMRPGEAVILRPCDLDRSGAVWVYRPPSHKTEHHGKERAIYLGPVAQGVLGPWLEETARPEDYVFRAGAVSRWGEGRPVVVSSYYRAIKRACRKAGVEPWSPNRLRHSAATRIRARFGIEAARIILGHSDMETSLIYAERDEEAIRKVVEEIG